GAAAGALAVQPRIDVALSEAPLASDAHRGNLPRLDEPVDRPEVDLKILEDLLRRQKRLVNHAFAVRGLGVTGNSTVKTAPPSGWFAARMFPPCSCTMPYSMARPRPVPW